MLIQKGIAGRDLSQSFIRPKMITIPFQLSADNGYDIKFRYTADPNGPVIAATIKDGQSGRPWADLSRVDIFNVTVQSGQWLYIHATAIESKPPVTGPNPCGVYLYDTYHKVVPTFVSGNNRAAGRTNTLWYNGPGWSHVVNGGSSGRFPWIFKVWCPVEYD